MDIMILTHPKPMLVRENIGMVFQHFNLFPSHERPKNIMFAPVEHKSNGPVKKLKVGIIVGKLGSQIKPMPTEQPFRWSKTTAIARGLAMNPDIMLFWRTDFCPGPEMVGDVLNVERVGRARHDHDRYPDGICPPSSQPGYLYRRRWIRRRQTRPNLRQPNTHAWKIFDTF